jgi:hypothetical protein
MPGSFNEMCVKERAIGPIASEKMRMQANALKKSGLLL